MHRLNTNTLLKEIEVAIEDKNYGRMYEIGGNLIVKAHNDNSWLEAVIIITGYLVKSPENVWSAIDLNKRAALIAPEQSKYQELTITALVVSINALPEPIERLEAAYSVVAVAPKKSTLILISIDLMLDNVEKIGDVSEKQRYIKIAISYSPSSSNVRIRANVLLKKAARHRSSADMQTEEKEDTRPLLGFVERHRANINDALAPPSTPPKIEPDASNK